MKCNLLCCYCFVYFQKFNECNTHATYLWLTLLAWDSIHAFRCSNLTDLLWVLWFLDQVCVMFCDKGCQVPLWKIHITKSWGRGNWHVLHSCVLLSFCCHLFSSQMPALWTSSSMSDINITAFRGNCVQLPKWSPASIRTSLSSSAFAGYSYKPRKIMPFAARRCIETF